MHNQPQLGEVITYHLLPAQRPTNPNKEWHGRVQVVCTPDVVLVELLEPGYEGLREFVRASQIVYVRSCK
jgi:hypothetical protein